MRAASASSSAAICVSNSALPGVASRCSLAALAVDELACEPLSPMDMGFSMSGAQPEGFLGLLRLADMCARVVMVTSRNHALRLILRMRVLRTFVVRNVLWP